MTDNERPKGYQWPADCLTASDMAILYHLREATGTPINRLLRDALLKYGQTANGQPDAQPSAATEP